MPNRTVKVNNKRWVRIVAAGNDIFYDTNSENEALFIFWRQGGFEGMSADKEATV